MLSKAPPEGGDKITLRVNLVTVGCMMVETREPGYNLWTGTYLKNVSVGEKWSKHRLDVFSKMEA